MKNLSQVELGTCFVVRKRSKVFDISTVTLDRGWALSLLRRGVCRERRRLLQLRKAHRGTWKVLGKNLLGWEVYFECRMFGWKRIICFRDPKQSDPEMLFSRGRLERGALPAGAQQAGLSKWSLSCYKEDVKDIRRRNVWRILGTPRNNSVQLKSWWALAAI